jgi:MFS family permease
MKQPAAATPRGASSAVLPASARRRLYAFLGLLVVLMAFGSPSGDLFEVALTLLLKNKLHLSASDISGFRAIIALPLYFSVLFGLVRDRWTPFSMNDRGLLLLFGSVTAGLYVALAFLPVTYATLLGSLLLLRVSFRLVSSAENGILASLGREHAMSGQISSLWNVLLSLIGLVGLLLAGTVSGLLEQADSDRAFHLLFLGCAAVVCGIVLYAWLRPAVVFDNIRSYRDERMHPFEDIKRLVRHWPLYPALLIMMLWTFAPGSDTALLFYLQNNFHATDAAWGVFNAIFVASFIPTTAVFGFLCTRLPLRKLLLWGTLIGVPQMIPLMYIRSMSDALLAATAMGLMGGVAMASYMALIIRSCPPGLEASTLLMSAALNIAVLRAGDILGTRLYEQFGGFAACVTAITIVYALILPLLLLVPRDLIATPDNVASVDGSRPRMA